MKVSLIITTYNSPEMLRLCLMSAAAQTRVPDEVIIADDGSGDDTRLLIEEFSRNFPCPIKHAWQEDRGFRAAEARNNAMRMCECDYVVMIDGDIIMERHFIADHSRLAQRGFFVVGSRSKLKPATTHHLIKRKSIQRHWYSRGVKSRFNSIYMPWLTRWTKNLYKKDWDKGRSANMAAFLDDLKAVNGFDSDMVGYGLEDTDIIVRLINYGLKRKWAKFQAIEYHLYHKEKSFVESNRPLLQNNLTRTMCKNGIKKL